MAESNYEKYAVRRPLMEPTFTAVTGRQVPSMTFMSSRLIPSADYHLQYGWILDMPEPNPHIVEHVHDHDQIILHLGGNPDLPQALGATIEFYIGGQPVIFDTTCAVYIPKGVPHGPLTWKEFRHPHIQLTLMLGDGNPTFFDTAMEVSRFIGQPTSKTGIFDYEQYVVRSPLREAGTIFTQGRQCPTMTYMSRNQINVADYYIELGWIWGMVEPDIPKMRHEKYDEIVMHIGGDPDHPEDLGATIAFGMGEDMLEFNTSHGLWIPRGLNHGPLSWKAVKKPHIEMAIMLGAGTFQEGWEDSFFE